MHCPPKSTIKKLTFLELSKGSYQGLMMLICLILMAPDLDAQLKIDTAGITVFDNSIVPYRDHFYIEYLDNKLRPCESKTAAMKRFVFYQKNKKCILYPTETIHYNSALYLNNKIVKPSDSTILMHGVFSIKNKKGRTLEKIYYDHGLITKHILKRGGFLHRKQNGKLVSEIAEFNYSEFPFTLHYIQINPKGEMITNILLRYQNETWHAENTDMAIPTDINK